MRPWQSCSQGPHRASVWAWWKVPVMCLYPLTIMGVIGRMYLGHRAIYAGQAEQLAREFRHEQHHGDVRREPLGV